MIRQIEAERSSETALPVRKEVSESYEAAKRGEREGGLWAEDLKMWKKEEKIIQVASVNHG